MRTSRIVGLAAMSWALGSATLLATIDIQKAFVAKYPKAKTTLGKCATCHTGPAPKKGAAKLNPFGTDIQGKVCGDKAKVLDFSKIEALDSDGDGVRNLAEIEAGTKPGDPASK
jgi:hypothetical protein